MKLAIGDLRARYRREVAALPRAPSDRSAIAPAELAHLPRQVRRYLDFVGAIGRPRVHDLHVTFRGEMRPAPRAPALHFEAEQRSTFSPRARLFLMRASRAGIPFAALHRYLGARATMEVKLASCIELVHASGPEMNQSETVTMFNDMCLLAPATLIDPGIRWTELTDARVRASFENAGNTIHAELTFGAEGELVLFTSDDRFQSADGKSFVRYRWSTPVLAYGSYGSLRLPARAEASWAHPDGEYVYGSFEVIDLRYDVGGA